MGGHAALRHKLLRKYTLLAWLPSKSFFLVHGEEVNSSLISKMSLSRGIGMNKALVLLCIRCTIVLLATNNKYAGKNIRHHLVALHLTLTFSHQKIWPFLAEAAFVWTAPPPAWNQTVQGVNNIQTVVVQVLNGSVNHHLRWNYTLLDGQSISLVFFSIGDGISLPDDIGFVSSGIATIINTNDYPTRFSIESTSEFSTLIIRTVTERENATFQCRIVTAGGTWAYNVRIFLTGKIQDFYCL